MTNLNYDHEETNAIQRLFVVLLMAVFSLGFLVIGAWVHRIGDLQIHPIITLVVFVYSGARIYVYLFNTYSGWSE